VEKMGFLLLFGIYFKDAINIQNYNHFCISVYVKQNNLSEIIILKCMKVQ